jgi:hypothetical protein
MSPFQSANSVGNGKLHDLMRRLVNKYEIF